MCQDTVEDTYVSLTDIQDVFGPVVRRMVEGETKVSRLPRSARNPSHSRTNEQVRGWGSRTKLPRRPKVPC